MNKPIANIHVAGEEHWTTKGDVKLFLWEKRSTAPDKAGTILFVHGSSMASQPTFDLQVPGRPGSSAMDWFAAQGFDTWSVDMEGYGRSTKDRDNNAPISFGADDCAAAADRRAARRGGRCIRRPRSRRAHGSPRVVCRGAVAHAHGPRRSGRSPGRGRAWRPAGAAMRRAALTASSAR